VAERRPKFLRALGNALGLPTSVTDEDVIPHVSQTDAAEHLKRKRDASLETSINQAKYGKRTFPTATASGYATPVYRDASEIIQRSRENDRAISEPFFRDEKTWQVDRSSVRKNAQSRPHAPVPPMADFWPGVVDPKRVDMGPEDDTVGDPAAPFIRTPKKKEMGFLQKLINSLINY